MLSTLMSPVLTYLFDSSADTCSASLQSLDLGSFVASGCPKLAIAKLVGVVMLLSSLLVKAPTLLAIIQSKKAVGLSPTSVYLDCILYSNAAFYGLLSGYPFSAWGETLLVLVQSGIMVVLLWMYGGEKGGQKVGFATVAPPVAVYALYLFVVFAVLPPEYYYFLPRSNWPVIFVTRGSQIRLNYENKNTGSTALITMCMQAGGEWEMRNKAFSLGGEGCFGRERCLF